jgi:hypothetical protein
MGAPFGSPSSTSPLPIPPKGLHRRSRSFSELLSIASNSTGISHAQPWRDREAWAAIHSPSQGPVRSRKEGSVMDRSYGWMERLPAHDDHQGFEDHRRPVVGRDEFKFFHNTQTPSSQDQQDKSKPNHHHGKSRLNQTTTTVHVSRPASDSSSTVSTMDLSINPHTPPTSVDPHSPLHRSHPIPRSPHSAISTYSNENENDDLPLPPLLPHNVKRAHSPPAFTSVIPAQVPWAQRSTMRDIREASNLRWATPNSSIPSSPLGQPFSARPVENGNGRSTLEPPHTPEPRVHRRKRSMTAPSVFDNLKASECKETDSRPESGTLPRDTPSPPRPPRHPRRHLNPPTPIVMTMPIPRPTPGPPSYGYTPATPSSRDEDEYSTPLSSPLASSPVKSPAYCKPTLPLRSAVSHQSLRPASRRPATAPTHGSVKQLGVSPVKVQPFGSRMYTSPPPSAIANDRLSRKFSASSSTGRGGWI